MKNSNKSKLGFTLIELLVVVLVIGILASVALPQYDKAVKKSRATEVWNTVKALEPAVRSYYMANGTYKGLAADNIDVKVPDLKYWQMGSSGIISNGFLGCADPSRRDNECSLNFYRDDMDVRFYSFHGDVFDEGVCYGSKCRNYFSCSHEDIMDLGSSIHYSCTLL